MKTNEKKKLMHYYWRNTVNMIKMNKMNKMNLMIIYRDYFLSLFMFMYVIIVVFNIKYHTS